MRLSVRFKLVFLVFAALFFAAGCERADNSLLTAETDEPGYRRAKDLLRQGRNQEALVEFNKVIEKRGRVGSPESHLELGELYLRHIKDPIAAIFHLRKFREIAPNGPKSELVRQRIDMATREFARTLPANPLENNLERLDMDEVIQRLQRENDQLKADLAIVRAALAEAKQDASNQMISSSPVSSGLVTSAEGPVENTVLAVRPPADPRGQNAPNTFSIQTPTPTQVRPNPAQPTQPQTPPPTTGPYRKHTVAKGDTLYGLAQRYYGNRSRWRDIQAANRDVLGNGEPVLSLGMELKIPQ